MNPELLRCRRANFPSSHSPPPARVRELRGEAQSWGVLILPNPSGVPGACAPVNGKQAPLILPWGEASLEGGAPSLPRLLPWCGGGPLAHSAWTRPSTSRRG